MEIKVNINTITVPIDKIKPNDYNPKESMEENEHNRLQFEKVVKSIKETGYFSAIDVRELEDGTYEIVDGFHRWLALKTLGAVEMVVNNLGRISRDEAMVKTINKEDIKIPISEIKLAEVIDKIKEEYRKFLPYTSDEVDQKLKMLKFDWNQYKEDTTPVDSKNPREVECPECGNRFTI